MLKNTNLTKVICVIFCLLLSGCCSVNDDYNHFKTLYDNAGIYESYHNDSTSHLIINEYNIDTKTITNTDYCDESVHMNTTQVLNDKKITSTIHIEDDKIYYDLDGNKTYTSFENDMSNMNDISFNKEDIKSSKENNNQLIFEMSEDFCTNILSMNYVDLITKINKYENEMIITYEDDKLLQQSFTIKFDVMFDQDRITGVYEFNSEYSMVGDNKVEPLANKELYINEDVANNKTLEEFKNSLINDLGYTIDELGNYVSTFNNNEVYKFDFQNHIFTYVYANTSYSYDWINDVAVYEGCTLKFTDDSHLGDCNENKLKDLEELKLNYLTELALCGFNKMPLE